MSAAQEQAVHLAQHYFGLLAERAGIRWDEDNDVEIGLLVDCIVSAAKAAAVAELEKQAPEARQFQLEAGQAAAEVITIEFSSCE